MDRVMRDRNATRAERLTALRRAGLLDDAAIRVAAYAGDEWARGVLGEPVFDMGGRVIGHGRCRYPTPVTPHDWTAGLERLVVELPWDGSRCGWGEHDLAEALPGRVCSQCDEAGRHTMPHSQRTMLVAAVAAARVALRTLECEHAGADEHGCWDCQDTGYDNAEGPQAERAIEAAEAYLREPTPERADQAAEIAGATAADCLHDLAMTPVAIVLRDEGILSPGGRCRRTIQAAARVASWGAVRPAVCAAVIGEVLP